MTALLALISGLLIPSTPPTTLDDGQYSSTTAVREVWQPYVGAGAVEQRKNGIWMPFELASSKTRAFWDRKVSLDLRRVDRFQFSLFIEDATKVSPTVWLYFQSGAGWYSGMFTVETGWNKISISKAQFGVEGTPEVGARSARFV